MVDAMFQMLFFASHSAGDLFFLKANKRKYEFIIVITNRNIVENMDITNWLNIQFMKNLIDSKLKRGFI